MLTSLFLQYVEYFQSLQYISKQCIKELGNPVCSEVSWAIVPAIMGGGG